MSRFNNPKASHALISHPALGAASVAAVPPSLVVNAGSGLGSAPKQAFTIGAETKPNMLQHVCFFVVCTYLLSACANDLIFHFTHGRAYISAACMIMLPLLFLGTGTFLRGVQIPAGRWFAAFVVWLAVATPFSVWRGGSAHLLLNYVPRSFLICFYLAACAVTVHQVRIAIRVVGVGALFVILSCYAFGGWIEGRFSIPDSLYFNNANELALQLLLGITILMYSFFEKNKWAKLASVAGIVASLIFMLKTGSRGVMLATLLTGLLVLVTSRRKIAVAALAVPALLIAVVLAPPEMRHRVTLVVIGDTPIQEADSSAVGSQMQREQLLKTSIWLTITNPLFGVGPGQFAVKVSGDQEKKGEHADWLGTHNSYTQVSSEAGLPAFIFYLATIVTCMRSNYWVHRRSKGRAGLEAVSGMSFCLFLSLFAYCIAIFFFHEAYGLQLPVMAGLSMALYLTAKPLLERYEPGRV